MLFLFIYIFFVGLVNVKQSILIYIDNVYVCTYIYMWVCLFNCNTEVFKFKKLNEQNKDEKFNYLSKKN